MSDVLTPHPYIERIFKTLGEHDPIEILEQTPNKLEFLISTLTEENIERSYAPGKWTVREILAHLADVELALGYRFRQALVIDHYQVEGFEQDDWAKRYPRLSPSIALETFRALRSWNLLLFASFDMEDWSKELNYSFEGIENIDHMVRFLAGHDLNHLAQLEQIVGAQVDAD
nr:hypothetical protein [uncultured bacterium]